MTPEQGREDAEGLVAVLLIAFVLVLLIHGGAGP